MISLTVTIVNTTETVISRFNPHERECFTNREFDLERLSWANGYRYSFTNCIYEALLYKIIDNCKCTPEYFAWVSEDIDYPLCR